MADQKIFAGPRIRRIRIAKGLTQTAMAEGLGISPSYLNLIERNQRPLTVQLILKLASVYKIDPHELQGEARGSISALKEVFGDPLLAGELPGDQELIELAEAAPNASAAMIKLFRAYREQAERLSDLNELLAREGRATALSGARLPIDEVHEIFERRPNHFAALEEEAEAFTSVLDPGDDLFAALKAWLKREYGIVVKVLPVATMPNWRRRYDRHSQRLFLSERLSPFDQLREVAMEACLIRMTVAVAGEIQALKLATDEARRLARFELGRYAAHALMMPYQSFHAAAHPARYDIDVLRSRFNVAEQAATPDDAAQPGAYRRTVLHAQVALADFPVPTPTATAVQRYSRVNIGVAVAGQDALVVPTVFDADKKSLGTIAAEARRLAERVRYGQDHAAGALRRHVHDLEPRDVRHPPLRRAVINPPQAAILAVGELTPRPVVRDGEIVIRAVMELTLSCDHRNLYGADAAEFLAKIREYLESPLRLAL